MFFLVQKLQKAALPVLPPLTTSSVHVPVENSPQLCVVMNAQLLKPSVDVSRGRLVSKVDLVPDGDLLASNE